MSSKFPISGRLVAVACGVLLVIGLSFRSGREHRSVPKGTPQQETASTPEAPAPEASADDSTPLPPTDGAPLDDKMDSELLSEAAGRFAQTDPKAGIHAAEDLKDEHLRQAYLTALFRAWGKWDGRGAAEFIAEGQDADFGGLKRGPVMVEAASGWAEADPAAAADWVAEHFGTNDSKALALNEALDGVIGAWGGSDAKTALSWLGERTGLEKRQELYSALAYGWAQKHPKDAAAQGLQLSANSDAREGFLNGALVAWSQQSPSEAVAWFQASIDPKEIPLLQETVKSMGLALEHTDPQGALTWANTMPGNALRAEMMSSITFPWMNEAPDAALLAVQNQIPAGDPVRAEVIANAVKHWSQTDPTAASDWLAAQPAGPERDQSVAVYSDAVSVEQPQRAATWAASIQDPAARQAALTQVMREWIQGAPDQALQWCQAQSNTLGPAFVEQVKQMIAQR
jgi:hypothetical protein